MVLRGKTITTWRGWYFESTRPLPDDDSRSEVVVAERNTIIPIGLRVTLRYAEGYFVYQVVKSQKGNPMMGQFSEMMAQNGTNVSGMTDLTC